jgi:hypothetical protein
MAYAFEGVIGCPILGSSWRSSSLYFNRWNHSDTIRNQCARERQSIVTLSRACQVKDNLMLPVAPPLGNVTPICAWPRLSKADGVDLTDSYRKHDGRRTSRNMFLNTFESAYCIVTGFVCWEKSFESFGWGKHLASCKVSKCKHSHKGNIKGPDDGVCVCVLSVSCTYYSIRSFQLILLEPKLNNRNLIIKSKTEMRSVRLHATVLECTALRMRLALTQNGCVR